MTTVLSNVMERLHQPEYTGENRCVPCTVVNLVIAAAVTAAIVAIGSITVGVAPSIVLGAVIALVSAGAIYVRGYLVPGTPKFTETYFPDWLLRRFDKRPITPRVDASDVDLEATLKRAGIVTECEGVDDLCLTDRFRTDWYDRIRDVRDGDALREAFAAFLDEDPERVAFRSYDSAFVVLLDGRVVDRWESRAASVADMAATNELRGRYDGWSTIDVDRKLQYLRGLRIFLDRCPDCDSPVTVDEEVVGSCCRSIDVVASRCTNCGTRVCEMEYDAAV